MRDVIEERNKSIINFHFLCDILCRDFFLFFFACYSRRMDLCSLHKQHTRRMHRIMPFRFAWKMKICSSSFLYSSCSLLLHAFTAVQRQRVWNYNNKNPDRFTLIKRRRNSRFHFIPRAYWFQILFRLISLTHPTSRYWNTNNCIKNSIAMVANAHTSLQGV